MAALEEECRATHRSPPSTPTPSSTTGPGARRWSSATGVNTNLVWPSIELKAARGRRGRDVLLLTGVEPDGAWHRVRRRHRRSAPRARRPDDGRPRRLPLRRAPHPAEPARQRAADRRAAGHAAVPEELGRRPRRHPCRSGARPHRPRHPGADAVGPGAALRRHDGLPGGLGRAARRAARGHRHGHRRRGAAPRGGAAADPPRRAGRRQRRAHGDARPARAGLRRSAGADDQTGLGVIDPDQLPSGDELAAELERFLRDQG